MSEFLIVYLFVLALLDSINPSALVVTGAILFVSKNNDRFKNIYSYMLGIFVSYLAIGVITLAGFSGLIEFIKTIGSSQLNVISQAIVGALLLGYAVMAPVRADPTKQQALITKVKKRLNPKLLFVYGMYVTVTELVTALPYFAALTILARADLALGVDVLALIVYCVIFVSPPLVLTFVYKRHKEKLDAWLKAKSQKFSSSGRETMLWIVGIAGAIMLFRAINKLDLALLQFG